MNSTPASTGYLLGPVLVLNVVTEALHDMQWARVAWLLCLILGLVLGTDQLVPQLPRGEVSEWLLVLTASTVHAEEPLGLLEE